ncbi:Amino acid permease family protein [Candida parapsilosis]|uniref:GABA-specific permease n=2 Tax=Candida parapsilosis TaxID=5480 RepID=G8BFN8_CANPC|nr:uncharacterized protein CPAR2_203150 [Candida parapsilosis]KAF6055178.1 Amino acid permease family protein [Candida parapsilosis]KAF6055799.1 Amino acid permease family protein [Candida parapsilosis]KAF6058729.1 Amino acid permease family protein [Candida parapsilosis]KAF6067486.1 Amino acid permease family protein [Candida parapsilosis]KAI5901393.1 GABA-specific permease [Candida parapsilosis]
MKALSPVISLRNVHTNASAVRFVDPQHNLGDVDLLRQIGYKQELRRHYSTIQCFGIAFSIMGLVPSIASVMATGLATGPAGLVWGWFIAGLFIICVGLSMSFMGSAIPTSGGLYYYSNYYCPDRYRIVLSYLIGCSNSLGLTSAICSITYGFAIEVLSAVSISMDNNFEHTNLKTYGVFAAGIVSNMVIACLTTKHAAKFQTFSICVNVFLIVLFLIAVPVGFSKNNSFNSGKYIFGQWENQRDWPMGWSAIMSWNPAIWTIGAFDSVIHCSEEALNAQRSIPIGILGSILACWVTGWVIVIVCAACIKDGDTVRVLASETGSAMAQIIYDALGKKWAVAFMSLICVGQYLMAISLMIALSRQVWSFARDDGLPVVYKWVKYVDPKIKVPIRATIFAGCCALVMGCLCIIPGSAGANALFSLAIASNTLSWGTPVVLLVLPYGRKKFIPGPFYFGKTKSLMVNIVTTLFLPFVIAMNMVPDSTRVDKDSMNYTCLVNGGAWLLCIIYYYLWAYKNYTGPKSNLDGTESEGEETSSVKNIEGVLEEKT